MQFVPPESKNQMTIINHAKRFFALIDDGPAFALGSVRNMSYEDISAAELTPGPFGAMYHRYVFSVWVAVASIR